MSPRFSAVSPTSTKVTLWQTEQLPLNSGLPLGVTAINNSGFVMVTQAALPAPEPSKNAGSGVSPLLSILGSQPRVRLNSIAFLFQAAFGIEPKFYLRRVLSDARLCFPFWRGLFWRKRDRKSRRQSHCLSVRTVDRRSASTHL
jgi:hypothetical protein